MDCKEFSDRFDVLYNNITSNQAPGLTEYEKSVFLTKAQNEIVKNYFTANSPGNTIQQGFDDSAKRQADFSCLMATKDVAYNSSFQNISNKIDIRSSIYKLPPEVFIVINESYIENPNAANKSILQVIPLRYDEYTRQMSKPFKRPLKYQAWRLINSGDAETKYAEIVTSVNNPQGTYKVRFITFPRPIIVGEIDDLTIDGYPKRDSAEYQNNPTDVTECQLDPILHEEILQRAVELAKIAWTSTGQDNMQSFIQAGQRSQ
jgi:hypothetical protein